MKQDLANVKDLRCTNHLLREAAARCPECNRYFCRECITEHEDRVYCAACLAKVLNRGRQKQSRAWSLLRLVQFILSFVLLWACFYYLGQALLMIPDTFHEGSIWRQEQE
jgi:hypothetical protein